MCYHWVKGHAGDPENERCDRLSTAAQAAPDLPADQPYERTQQGTAPPLLDAAS